MTTITLPDHLAEQLQRRAATAQRSVEALAIAYIESGLTEEDAPLDEHPSGPLNEDPELLALIARIKAGPRPARVIPSQEKLAALLATMVQGEPNLDLLAALDAAELEQRALDRADEIAEGRG